MYSKNIITTFTSSNNETMTNQELMRLANRLLEEGLAYDRSHAIKLAKQGHNDTHQFGFVDGKFVIEDRF